MKKYLSLLHTVNLFDEFTDSDILTILDCFDAKIISYKKNSIVLDCEHYFQNIGIVLHGELQNIVIDFTGARSIIANFVDGDIFAEALVCAEVMEPSILIQAVNDTTIMYLDFNKILSVCKKACSFHMKLLRNMLKILAQKNIYLNKKLGHVTKRSTKEKIMAYLSDTALQFGRKSFSIPYDRQGLADYLAVERSALSAELSKLRDEGFLLFNKNQFTLK